MADEARDRSRKRHETRKCFVIIGNEDMEAKKLFTPKGMPGQVGL
jgi:hypothetical protein